MLIRCALTQEHMKERIMDPILFQPIGVIRTPCAKPEGMPIQAAEAAGHLGTAEVDAAYLEGLADIGGFSHLSPAVSPASRTPRRPHRHALPGPAAARRFRHPRAGAPECHRPVGRQAAGRQRPQA
jgi:hypothetical protein